MIVDQNEIDALLQSAQAGDAGQTSASKQSRSVVIDTSDPNIRRILRLRVPVTVRLAERRLSISSIMRLAPGAIIEFEKDGESELDLTVANHVVGRGCVVKVGENFGLRITAIGPLKDRIRKMGG